ncbi:phosphotransferase enzyme family protein [Laceyella putida]|uniref:Phosphotransferase enzyme family protein n=1 Tax=Laceyella putida TaxID=110101 RepID=A0ABW2RNA3_9BACL
MKKEIASLINYKTIAAIARKYDLNPNRLIRLDGNVNAVYEYQDHHNPMILRLTPSHRRSFEEVLAEVDFVHYLAGKGGPVTDVIPSSEGNLAEQAEHGLTAVLFEKAKGRLPQQADWNERLFYQWGKLTGWLHAHSCSYQPAVPYRRREWWEEDLLKVEESIPPSETLVLKRAEELMNQLHSLTKESNSYGLIHSDLHTRNFFIQANSITAFDFDDSCYHWFINDIAIILYHSLTRFGKPPGRGKGEREFASDFLIHFKKGYETEHHLDAYWWKWLPVFMKLRRIAMYVFYHQKLDFTQLTGERARVIAQTRQDIENDLPVTRLDMADWLRLE